MEHVIVNGVQGLKSGEHTGMTPGRFVHGPTIEEVQGMAMSS